MIKLEDAIREGERLKNARVKEVEIKRQTERDEAQKRFDKQVEEYKKTLTRDYLLERVKDAVARGETSFTVDGPLAVAVAIKSYEGFVVDHKSYYENINSDEIKELVEFSVVRWQT